MKENDKCIKCTLQLGKGGILWLPHSPLKYILLLCSMPIVDSGTAILHLCHRFDNISIGESRLTTENSNTYAHYICTSFAFWTSFLSWLKSYLHAPTILKTDVSSIIEPVLASDNRFWKQNRCPTTTRGLGRPWHTIQTVATIPSPSKRYSTNSRAMPTSGKHQCGRVRATLLT